MFHLYVSNIHLASSLSLSGVSPSKFVLWVHAWKRQIITRHLQTEKKHHKYALYKSITFFHCLGRLSASSLKQATEKEEAAGAALTSSSLTTNVLSSSIYESPLVTNAVGGRMTCNDCIVSDLGHVFVSMNLFCMSKHQKYTQAFPFLRDDCAHLL